MLSDRLSLFPFFFFLILSFPLPHDYATTICCHSSSKVCGVDGKTYNSKCEAACAKVAVASQGRCTFISKCSDSQSAYAAYCDKAPVNVVCGSDSRNYKNAYCAQVRCLTRKGEAVVMCS